MVVLAGTPGVQQASQPARPGRLYLRQAVSTSRPALPARPARRPPGRTAPRLARRPPTQIEVLSRQLGVISPGLFGANLLWPYNAEGAFNPKTGRFYPAFISLVRQLGITSVRYPGGTSSDSFQWLRAIGPAGRRQPNEPYGMQDGKLSSLCCIVDTPVRSSVGPDELGQLLNDINGTGVITVNFVTGTARQAAEWVAYMTAPQTRHPSANPAQPSYWAALRARDGHPAPYTVPYWEVGNEQDGPGQFGWRSGSLVSIGPHRGPCPSGDTATCLYAFGGTVAFQHEPVGRFANDIRGCSRSSGAPHQSFYVYFPPVVPRTQVISVAGQPWQPVRSLAQASPHQQAYQINLATGKVTFGDGRHGAIPPRGATITATYESGPHDGFVQFYTAMKKMNPQAQICEAEEDNLQFPQIMGRTYPYDCDELHLYADPQDLRAPMVRYEQALAAIPAAEGTKLGRLQHALGQYTGRHIPVVVTEYGQLIWPVPAADHEFNLSLDEGLLVASQLCQWADHGVPVADKYLLDSIPFSPTYRINLGAKRQAAPRYRLAHRPVPHGLSVINAMIAVLGHRFVPEPSGQALSLMSRLGGTSRLSSAVINNPPMRPYPDEQVPMLHQIAARADGHLDLVVINASPTVAVPAYINIRLAVQPGPAAVSVLNGPSSLAYNTGPHPRTVAVTTSTVQIPGSRFDWVFPAHSATLLQLRLGAT
jgi:alpha-N-arabinofuranosidase